MSPRALPDSSLLVIEAPPLTHSAYDGGAKDEKRHRH